MADVFKDLGLKDENIDAMTKANFSNLTDPSNEVSQILLFIQHDDVME